MQKLFLLIFSLFFALSAWANVDLGPLLNKVTLQLQAEQWVTTKTAIVSVTVNAALTDQGIGNIQVDVLNKLKQLSDKGEWHMVAFNRQLDQSGLENIHISAQARLPQTDLAGLRNKAKSLSKPGETFTIDNVQFTPSDEETKIANTLLRNNLYLQAKAEIDALNKIYPDQKYYLYNIEFISQSPALPGPMTAVAFVEKAAPNRPAAAQVPVGNKVQLQALVVIASMPNVVTQKLTQ